MTVATRRLVALPLIVVGLAALALLMRPDDDRLTVRAAFENINGLTEGAEVKVDGAQVGTVSDLELRDDHVVVSMELGGETGRVGRDARAAIKPKNLLGAKVVDLEPGNSAQELAGAVIPTSRTSTPIDLDNVLDALDSSTRVRLRILIAEFGRSLAGRGTDVAELLDVAPRSLDQIATLIREVGSGNDQLSGLLAETDRLVAAVEPEKRSLQLVIDRAMTTLRATGDRRAELGELLDEASPTLVQLRGSLRRLSTTASALEPAATGLRRTAAPLDGALAQLEQVEPSAVATLDTAKQVSAPLDRLLERVAPLTRDLVPTSRQLARTADDADGATSVLDRAIVDTVATLEGWSRVVQTRDAAGHMFRASLSLSSDLAKALLDAYVRPTRRGSKKKEPTRSAKPIPERLPQLTETPTPAPAGPALPKLPQLPKLPIVPKVVEQLPETVDGVTDVLDFLLGP